MGQKGENPRGRVQKTVKIRVHIALGKGGDIRFWFLETSNFREDKSGYGRVRGKAIWFMECK